MTINQIINELYNRYYSYYSTVYIGILEEAVKNTLHDIKTYDIDLIHKHIKENYI